MGATYRPARGGDAVLRAGALRPGTVYGAGARALARAADVSVRAIRPVRRAAPYNRRAASHNAA
ncbi:hypothetical protein ABT140_21705, partial [Streptomyces californicus]|uniref:hypothetical protein n=1 Tax=Streptomyces californicus TaxID=67351 RepID=UPI003329589C